MRITAAVLAGGSSSRMGEDKAELVWRGKTLLERAVETCREAGLEVLVVGRQRAESWRIDGVEFIPDSCPGLGPLGGLITALEQTADADAAVLAIACDMPLLDRAALSWLADEFRRSEEHGDGLVAVSLDGRVQPLFAVYAGSALPGLGQCLASGRRSLTGAIEAGRFRRVAIPEEYDPKLTNINTPNDIARLG